ncbi:hypothetical protein BpHYR1_039946 [Brachionus plicatilis]|uniref:Uncharacterized protein n=1 Tax=Brachionus plicatilis TaxID=10195 RepID=A0A3M7PMD7_BRAPC|nr:hypothetical protein BpHYR1_039946 [Brachionus plicatilis]
MINSLGRVGTGKVLDVFDHFNSILIKFKLFTGVILDVDGLAPSSINTYVCRASAAVVKLI